MFSYFISVSTSDVSVSLNHKTHKYEYTVLSSDFSTIETKLKNPPSTFITNLETTTSYTINHIEPKDMDIKIDNKPMDVEYSVTGNMMVTLGCNMNHIKKHNPNVLYWSSVKDKLI